MAMAKDESKETVQEVESKFSKDQLLKSVRYQHQCDLLSALLGDKETYSHSDVERIINNFMKGTVK